MGRFFAEASPLDKKRSAGESTEEPSRKRVPPPYEYNKTKVLTRVVGELKTRDGIIDRMILANDIARELGQYQHQHVYTILHVLSGIGYLEEANHGKICSYRIINENLTYSEVLDNCMGYGAMSELKALPDITCAIIDCLSQGLTRAEIKTKLTLSDHKFSDCCSILRECNLIQNGFEPIVLNREWSASLIPTTFSTVAPTVELTAGPTEALTEEQQITVECLSMLKGQ